MGGVMVERKKSLGRSLGKRGFKIKREVLRKELIRK